MGNIVVGKNFVNAKLLWVDFVHILVIFLHDLSVLFQPIISSDLPSADSSGDSCFRLARPRRNWLEWIVK